MTNIFSQLNFNPILLNQTRNFPKLFKTQRRTPPDFFKTLSNCLTRPRLLISNFKPHDLFIAKFEAYGLSKNNLKLLFDNLEGRKQRVEIGSSYSFWSDVKRGVPQGPWQLCFSMFLSMICFCLLRNVKL